MWRIINCNQILYSLHRNHDLYVFCKLFSCLLNFPNERKKNLFENKIIHTRTYVLYSYNDGIFEIIFQVEQYFRSLPQNKIPKLGSPGEKYRDKQLVYQLPKQDLALSYCKNVEPKDHQSYEDFINARNEIALDIAYVKECTTNDTVSI